MRVSRGSRAGGAGGFTLIEMLVVVAIIAVLAGLLIPVLGGFAGTGEAVKAQAAIAQISSALEAYVADFHDFPPNTLADMGLSANGLNAANESLVACLSTGQKSGPYVEIPESDLSNLDDDKVPDFNQSTFGVRSAFEWIDPWGNPYIYFNVRAYKSGDSYQKSVGTYLLGDELDRVLVKPVGSKKTGRYFNSTSYQVWSCGPDGINDNGGNDDIANFEAED